MGSSIAARALALLALVVSATAQAAAQQGGTAGVAAAPSQFQAGQQQPGVGAQGIQGAQGAQAPAGFAAMQGAQGAQGAQPPAGFAAMQGVAAPAPGAGTTSNNDILNYLLQLKYLQAAFYSWAAYGRGIPDDLRGGGPVATGGRKGNFTPQARGARRACAAARCKRLYACRGPPPRSECNVRAPDSPEPPAWYRCPRVDASRCGILMRRADAGVQRGAGASQRGPHSRAARHPWQRRSAAASA